ncbi:MAG: SDR family oxidoreductase [Clostridia bacterium]|nr:SDR family oxidoreductase [Clostridia bacterium]
MENVLEMFRLDGKVALVTGGAGSYGRTFSYGHQAVVGLLQAGADVWIASRTLKKNEEYAAMLKEQGLNKIHVATFDQGDEASILALRDKIMEESGRFDILVNNSVYRCKEPEGWYDDPAFFRKSLDINGTGLFLVTRTFGKIMIEQGEGGSIINIGSYMGELSADEYLYKDLNIDCWSGADYFYNKGGMHNMTRLFAGFFGPHNIRCNCVSLGGLFNYQDPLFLDRYCKKTFLGRMANETDLMGLIVYLASDASRYMTGAVIPLDGGYSAK